MRGFLWFNFFFIFVVLFLDLWLFLIIVGECGGSGNGWVRLMFDDECVWVWFMLLSDFGGFWKVDDMDCEGVDGVWLV